MPKSSTNASASTPPLYRVVFASRDKIYEVYAREVSQASLFGFVEIGDFVFGEKSGLLVDPAEEKLQAEFADVRSTYVPMHAIVRIDAVKSRGKAKISDLNSQVEAKSSAGSNITPFPIYTPGPVGEQ